MTESEVTVQATNGVFRDWLESYVIGKKLDLHLFTEPHELSAMDAFSFRVQGAGTITGVTSIAGPGELTVRFTTQPRRDSAVIDAALEALITAVRTEFSSTGRPRGTTAGLTADQVETMRIAKLSRKYGKQSRVIQRWERLRSHYGKPVGIVCELLLIDERRYYDDVQNMKKTGYWSDFMEGGASP